MSNLHISRLPSVLSLWVVFSAGARAEPTLMIVANPGVNGPAAPVMAGQLVQFVLTMNDLGAQSAAAFQAFVQFDSTAMQFHSGEYTSSPFGLPLIWPISATMSGSNGRISLAAGVNPLIGQPPTSQNAVLATLNFVANQSACAAPSLRFVAHEPPTRLSAANGADLLPLHLQSWRVCAADVNHDEVVGVADLLMVISRWGACTNNAVCCTGDITASGSVGVPDLLSVISHWGLCP